MIDVGGADASDSAEFHRQPDKVVKRHLSLADYIARWFQGRSESRDDLVQVARVGLVNAIVRFDTGTRSYYILFVLLTIVGEVRRYFRDNSLVGHPPASELASALGMERDEVVESSVGGDASVIVDTLGDLNAGLE